MAALGTGDSHVRHFEKRAIVGEGLCNGAVTPSAVPGEREGFVLTGFAGHTPGTARCVKIVRCAYSLSLP